MHALPCVKLPPRPRTCGPGDPLLGGILAAGDALHAHIRAAADADARHLRLRPLHHAQRLLLRALHLHLLLLLLLLRLSCRRWGRAGLLAGRPPASLATQLEVFVI